MCSNAISVPSKAKALGSINKCANFVTYSFSRKNFEQSQVPLVRENTSQQGSRLWHNTVALSTLVSPRFLSPSLCLLHQRGSFSSAVLSFHSSPSYSTGTWEKRPDKNNAPSCWLPLWRNVAKKHGEWEVYKEPIRTRTHIFQQSLHCAIRIHIRITI